MIPGNKNCPVRNIHWLEQPGSTIDKNPLYAGGKKRRLLTTGLNGQVTEWDLCSGKIKHKFAAHAGVWDSCRFKTTANAKLMALACEDGSIKLVKIKKGEIVLQRTLSKILGVRCLSLEISADDKFIWAGYSDGSIRKWDLEASNCIL